MCCLFGLIDYRKNLPAREKNRMLSVLASACEARGTDATGIAYNLGGSLRIYKRPVPAHRLHFRVPEQATVIMGHIMVSQAAHFYDNEILGYQAQSYRGKSSKKEWWYVAASKNCPDTGRRGPSTISLKNLC